MTPAEYTKQVTLLLSELLVDTGFYKKRIGRLMRNTKECEQNIILSFTRGRGLPITSYPVNLNLTFTFKEMNRLASKFLGKEYDAKSHTGLQPLYAIIPGKSLSRIDYRSDEPLNQYAERVADDFRSYALPYFEKYDTLEKLEVYFDQYLVQKIGEHGFHNANGLGPKGVSNCYFAAILCLLGKWEKLYMLLESIDWFPDQKERIIEYISNQ